MNAWGAVALVTALAVAGGLAGWGFSRWCSRWWIIGYLLPLQWAALIGLQRWFPKLAFMQPFASLSIGHCEYFVGAFAIPLLLMTPLPRLTNRRLKLLTGIAMVVAWMHYSGWVFLSAALARSELATLQTHVDRNGVCHQGNGYTCGPAAAVTALRLHGIDGQESEIALRAWTCNAVGTEPDILAQTLNEMYGDVGIQCRHRYFSNLEDLRQEGTTIVIIKFSFNTDHYVTVMEITPEEVVVGDPLQGLTRHSHEEFVEIWRRTGVVVARQVSPDRVP